MIAVLAGGVGAARFLRGLVRSTNTSEITAIVNTADDTVLHGLNISPDIDTVTYTLANAIDPVRGWGLENETWTAMEALGRYVAVRPPLSGAAPNWFNLGDKDLATHFYRTARLGEGATLEQVTAEICVRMGNWRPTRTHDERPRKDDCYLGARLFGRPCRNRDQFPGIFRSTSSCCFDLESSI